MLLNRELRLASILLALINVVVPLPTCCLLEGCMTNSLVLRFLSSLLSLYESLKMHGTSPEGILATIFALFLPEERPLMPLWSDEDGLFSGLITSTGFSWKLFFFFES